MADEDRVSQVRDTLKKMQKNLECPICLELLSDPYTTQCGHPFCRICIYTVISSNREAKCPLCKERISKRSMNENSRLGEIVEAVKQLEQAFIEDTGILKTPPRPLPPHSHEATGSPGIALHSKLHPSPRKKPHPRSKRTMDDVNPSTSTASQAPRKNISTGTIHQEPTVVDMRSDSAIKGELSKLEGERDSGHGKLSIKRRRKKVQFSVEKPTALLHEARKVSTSSSSTMESAASGSRNLLSMFTEEEERMEIGNGKLETASSEQVGMENGNGNMEEVCISGSGNEDENEGANSPARKKVRLDSSPAKINRTLSLSQEVPCSSQQLGTDVSCLLETPAPASQMRCNNFTISISRVVLSNRFTIQPEFDSNKLNKREGKNNCKNALDHVDSSQPVSTKLCAHQDIASVDNNSKVKDRPQPIASVAMTETPFIQAPGLSSCSSSVTKVMETPFISNNNIQVPSDDEEIIVNPRLPSDGDVEQCESVLANETEICMEDDHNRTLTSDKIHSQMEKAENLLSDSILAKETQDTTDHQLKNDQSSSDHDDSLSTDGSCTVLGPTPITSVPESQFSSRSVITPKSKAVLPQSPPQIIDKSSLNHSQKVDEDDDHKMPTQHDPRRSSSESESSTTCICSPVQSGGTVCIGETQFTKSESKLSPKERQTAVITVHVPPATGAYTMPSPPASPSEIQSPIIPLQNSTHHISHLDSMVQVQMQGSQRQQPSGSVSKIAETQFSTSSSDCGIVPSSQPSPTAFRRQSTVSLLKLPGLTTVHYHKPQPQATMADDRISPEQKQKEDTKENSESQVSTICTQQSEEGGYSVKSPSKSLTEEQNQNEFIAESTIHVDTERELGCSIGGVNVPLSSMSLAYSSLQSQRASLRSQISSSVDLSSQQLELLRLEMEAKQREIDELEAALRQVEEDEEREIQPETPSASTQSSVRSITAIAETMPTGTCNSTGQMATPNRVSSPEHFAVRSDDNPLSGQAKSPTAIADTIESAHTSCNIGQKRIASPERMDLCAPESIENPLSEQAKSNTAIEDTTSGNSNVQERTASPECMEVHVYAPESIEYLLSGHTKSPEHSQMAAKSPDHVSIIPATFVTNSQVSREQRSTGHSQIRTSTSSASCFSSQIPSDESTTVKIQAFVTRIAPNSHQVAAPEHLHSSKNDSQSINAARSSDLCKSTPPLHSEIETGDTESDASSDCEAPCTTSQSVLATLQAADDVLRKLRSPPLPVLEERSTMEIDTDLYSSGTPAPKKQSLKAKKLRVSSTDAAKSTGASDKTQKEATLEVDNQLCASAGSMKEEISAKKGKGSTRGNRALSASTKLMSKKIKKARLVVYESEDTAIPRLLPEFRNQNQQTTKSSSSSIVTGTKSSELARPSSPCLPSSSTAQSPDQDHCSRECGCGSTTPTCGVVVTLQTPKAQCSSNSGTTTAVAMASSSSSDGGGGGGREVFIVSPFRLLSRVGKDHPPSYIGSGLSKTQLRDVQALARRYGGRLASCFNGSTSHVIVSADENGLCSRTVKYLQGLATGRWIVSHQWVTESLDAGRLLPESQYEIIGDHVTSTITQAPMRSRKLHLKESPGLFADYAFLFVGAFRSIPQDHLAQLIHLSGGCLVSSAEELTSLDKSTTCAVCDEERLPSGCGLVQVKSEWVLDCLSNYSVLPISSSQNRQDNSN